MENLGLCVGVATAERYQAAGRESFPYRDGDDSAEDLAQAQPPPVAGPASILRRIEAGWTKEPLPIWLAVLMATSCHARSSRENHAVRWRHISGRATYTNAGSEDERIEPLGVCVPGGQTLAVWWIPGETGYSLEVYAQ
jgi:hypothetical protein